SSGVVFFAWLFPFFAPASTSISALSLHDALPICVLPVPQVGAVGEHLQPTPRRLLEHLQLGDRSPVRHEHGLLHGGVDVDHAQRSEEHTSELQSRENLVCRLLLEKKNKGEHNADE